MFRCELPIGQPIALQKALKTKVLLIRIQTQQYTIPMNLTSTLLNIISWLFGALVVAIGLVNTFYGNDPFFGIFLALLAFVYFPPIDTLIKDYTGLTIPRLVKIGLGVFIIWAAVGVGELFEKVDMIPGINPG